MTGLIDTFFNLQVMLQYLPKVLEGMGVTIVLALAVVASGLALGLALGVLRSLQIRVLNALIVLFADVFRAVPPLVILIIIYFALPTVGVRFSGFASAWIGLSLVLAAFAKKSCGRAFCRCHAGSGKRRARAGSVFHRRCAWWCCRRPCA